MNTEIEVKILDVSFDDIRSKLTELGGTREQPMRLMRRVIFQNDATGKNAYIRLRDEGNKVTLTYKSFESLSLHGASEIETAVEDFDATLQILKAGGFAPRSFQESKRETWRLGEVEIVLDEWPWLKPYIEIEGPSEDLVRATAARLAFDWDSQAVFGDVMTAYRAEYPHLTETDTVGDIAEVKFDDPLPKLLTK